MQNINLDSLANVRESLSTDDGDNDILFIDNNHIKNNAKKQNSKEKTYLDYLDDDYESFVNNNGLDNFEIEDASPREAIQANSSNTPSSNRRQRRLSGLPFQVPQLHNSKPTTKPPTPSKPPPSPSPRSNTSSSVATPAHTPPHNPSPPTTAPNIPNRQRPHSALVHTPATITTRARTPQTSSQIRHTSHAPSGPSQPPPTPPIKLATTYSENPNNISTYDQINLTNALIKTSTNKPNHNTNNNNRHSIISTKPLPLEVSLTPTITQMSQHAKQIPEKPPSSSHSPTNKQHYKWDELLDDSYASAPKSHNELDHNRSKYNSSSENIRKSITINELVSSSDSTKDPHSTPNSHSDLTNKIKTKPKPSSGNHEISGRTSNSKIRSSSFSDLNKDNSNSAKKLANFLEFLDNAENIEPGSGGAATPQQDEILLKFQHNVVDSGSLSDKVAALKSRVVELEVEVDDKAKTVEAMKNTIKKMRTKEQATLVEHEKTLKEQTNTQQKEHQEILQRHLSFIDRLMNDKKELSDRCENLAAEIQERDKKFEEKLKEVDERIAREVKKSKEAWSAAEKIKRDSWIQEKTKEIKEMTVKGLEPEIHKLLAKHKHDCKSLDDKYQSEMKKTRDEITNNYEAQMQHLRMRITHEGKDEVEKERERNKSLLREFTEREQDQLRQQARRLEQDFHAEKVKIEETHRAEKMQLEDKIMRMKNNEELLNSKLKDHVDSAYQDLLRKHQTEIMALKEKLDIEKEQWQTRVLNKMQADMKLQEEEIKKKYMKERDEEIEHIIARFESESSSSISGERKVFEEKLNAMKDKHSSQINELKESEKSWKSKHLELVQTHAEKEEKLAEHKSKLASLESQLAQKDDKLAKLEANLKSTENLVKMKDSEIENKVAAAAEMYTLQIKNLQDELSEANEKYTELQTKFQDGMDEINRLKENELDELHVRVKTAIKKKDETIQSLKESLQTAEIRVKQTELLLQKQRNELLG